MPPTILWQALLLYFNIEEERFLRYLNTKVVLDQRKYQRTRRFMIDRRKERAKVIREYFEAHPEADSWIAKRFCQLAEIGKKHCLVPATR